MGDWTATFLTVSTECGPQVRLTKWELIRPCYHSVLKPLLSLPATPATPPTPHYLSLPRHKGPSSLRPSPSSSSWALTWVLSLQCPPTHFIAGCSRVTIRPAWPTVVYLQLLELWVTTPCAVTYIIPGLQKAGQWQKFSEHATTKYQLKIKCATNLSFPGACSGGIPWLYHSLCSEHTT